MMPYPRLQFLQKNCSAWCGTPICCAVRSALEEGILAGAGKALYEISFEDFLKNGHSVDQEVARNIFRVALRSPLVQILKNAGILVDNVYNEEVKEGHGYNLKTAEMGDLIEMGVIDPLKVTRSALQNAVSVATTILSTNAIITMARTYESN